VMVKKESKWSLVLSSNNTRNGGQIMDEEALEIREIGIPVCVSGHRSESASRFQVVECS
jgi:hypothetical protein